MSKSEIKEVFWIDKSVLKEENQIYKELMGRNIWLKSSPI